MAQSYPTIIPGLRSPFDQVNGLVYFGGRVNHRLREAPPPRKSKTKP